MSIPGAANPLLLRTAAAAGYTVSRSLRFNSSDSGYCSRTPASAGNRKTWTWSAWVKRSKLGTWQTIFSAYGAGNDTDYFSVQFSDADVINISAWSTGYLITSQVFRDVSAWYHILVALDTTQATAANRLRLYVNGSEVTAFSTDGRSSLTQNADRGVNGAFEHNLGRRPFSAFYYSDIYLAECHFIDGQQFTPSSFTETSATTGQLIPKKYTGTFTGNSFWLQFADNSAATATTLGKDSSGLGNNFTPTNFSVAAGAGNDSLVDTPTSYGTDTGAGGEVRGNYATLNPLDKGSSITLSNGNLDYAGGASSNTVRATFQPKSGKWYWEASGDANTIIGIASSSDSLTVYPGDLGTSGRGYYGGNGASIINGGVSATWATFTSTDVIGLALDVDAGTCAVYKNNSLQGTWTGLVNPVPAIGRTTGVASVNFGQRAFAYTAPSGFKALCDTNLPAPVVAKPSGSFDIALYTGNSSTQSITLPGGMSPDLVWVKTRSAATYYHALYDAVRGTGPSKSLYSNATDAEGAQSIYTNLTSFDSSGFSLGSTSPNNNILNQSGQTFVAWCWDAGSSTVTNTQGSITSSVRANASAGFSVVTYTGTGANATVGHGLGVAPDLVIVKRRDTTSDWQVRHTSIAAANSIQLNLANAAASATTVWNSTAPTSTVFSIGTDASVNASGGTYVAYCFAPQVGYSSFGSFVSNGSADNVFVYTGFRPRFLVYKSSSVVGAWIVIDSTRAATNVVGPFLSADGSGAEGSVTQLDLLSNGFKCRDSGFQNGTTYIYFAFAENPFQYARAR